MKLLQSELAFLSDWAKEEWEPACYSLPAHRLQISHDVRGAALTLLIKVWADCEGKKEHEILAAAGNAELRWPWATREEFQMRLDEDGRQQNRQPAPLSLDAIHANANHH